MTTPSQQLLDLVVLAFQGETLRRLTFSKPTAGAPARVVARLVVGRGKPLLACEETLEGGKVRHTTADRDELVGFLTPMIAAYGQINLSTGAGDAEYRRNKKGSEVLLGGAQLEKRLAGDKAGFRTYLGDLNRKKKHILSGSEPFLFPLGITDATGRIHDKKQAKFRQINRFLEHVEEIYPSLPEDGTLTVYDLCSGKSYLSFAVYFYLTETRGRKVEMLCMDLKRDVMEECATIARSLGFVGMSFVAGDIRGVSCDRQPHLVLSLHACDIATDIVLDTAAALGARVILSTPCCHRYLNDKLQMPVMSFVSDYPHLRGKLCEVVTEGIRLARLRAAGYSVTALEMTDPDDTPKNTLLRAILRPAFSPDSEEATRLKAEYEALLHLVLGEDTSAYLKEIRE